MAILDPTVPRSGMTRPRTVAAISAPDGFRSSNVLVLIVEAFIASLKVAITAVPAGTLVECGTPAAGVRTVHVKLAGAGAELVTTEMVGFEWVRTAEHPAFAELLALVR